MIKNFPQHRYELNESQILEFKIEKNRIKVEILRMDVTSDIILKGLVTVEMLTLAINIDAFHLGSETNLQNWDSQNEIDIVLKLDKKIAESFESTDELFADLFNEDSILQKAKSWYALEAMQFVQIPEDPESTTSFGIRTQWAD